MVMYTFILYVLVSFPINEVGKMTVLLRHKQDNDKLKFIIVDRQYHQVIPPLFT